MDIGVEGMGHTPRTALNLLSTAYLSLPAAARVPLSRTPGEACLLHRGSHRLVCHVGRGSDGHGVTSQVVNVSLTLSPETTPPPATTVRQSRRLGSEGN